MSGTINWQGEDMDDIGAISIKNDNQIEIKCKYYVRSSRDDINRLERQSRMKTKNIHIVCNSSYNRTVLQ